MHLPGVDDAKRPFPNLDALATGAEYVGAATHQTYRQTIVEMRHKCTRSERCPRDLDHLFRPSGLQEAIITVRTHIPLPLRDARNRSDLPRDAMLDVRPPHLLAVGSTSPLMRLSRYR